MNMELKEALHILSTYAIVNDDMINESHSLIKSINTIKEALTPPTQYELYDLMLERFEKIGYDEWEDCEHDERFYNTKYGYTIIFKHIGFQWEYYKIDKTGKRRAIDEKEHECISLFLKRFSR